ncbi:hypothetical protein COF71_13825 [Bacillus toyonensis]|nr:hypothetical protein COM61_22730 [Bacillus toyonensis]PHE47030.1 hypothetical protein COF71_13825 [Bacillus toyonensis]
MRYLIDSWKQINGNLFMAICLLPFLIGTIVMASLPTEATTKQPTLRDILSKPTPMTSSYEVVDVVNGEYHLVDVALDGNDQGTFILEGNYEVGDVVTVMWATEDSAEIAGDVKVGTASELDKQYCKAGCGK